MVRLSILVAIGWFFAARAAAEVFNSEKAHTIQISMSGEAWEAMQPGNAGKKALAKGTREEGRTAGVRLRPGGPGYAYVISEMDFDGKKIADVGIRFKGNSSYSVS